MRLSMDLEAHDLALLRDIAAALENTPGGWLTELVEDELDKNWRRCLHCDRPYSLDARLACGCRKEGS